MNRFKRFFNTGKMLVLMAVLVSVIACTTEKYKVKTATDSNGYQYEYVTNDPLNSRIYTLNNGLKVYLSYNPDEPRIATLIGVRAGSTSDPIETTGLAHYFEHMMFKGTDRIGALNWEKEKVLLDQISDLFEQKRATDDPELKKNIYRQIDSLSQLASALVAANEYDKMVSSLGAKMTNAGTSYESTVYMNDIPSNEFEKWLMVESERFKNMVLRLFHTELETVYEEFNMYQDSDRSRANKAMMEELFPTHPYGRDIIGLPEHLKNPSIVNIYQFAEIWYRPNNMAIALAGDLDMDETIVLVDQYFGNMEPNESLPKIEQPVEEPITEPRVREVYGPDAESVSLSFRFNGVGQEDEKFVKLIDMILSNSQAGLIDLNLNQQQKVLRSGAYSYFLRDYGIHSFYGQPREGQTLEEVKDLMLEEIEKVKNGAFDDWMIQAVINDMRLSEIRSQERNFSRAYKMISIFIEQLPYAERLKFMDELENLSKKQIMDFARQNYGTNYVVVYKRTGENKDLVKVEKPQITPVKINREDQSAFYNEFTKIETESIEPVFVDFQSAIQNDKLKSGIGISYIRNTTNELFNLQYIIDMGKNHNIRLPLAVNYLPYLGTDKYSPEELQKEFFRYGLSMNVNASDERCYISISGLQKSFEKGVELLEHVLSSVVPDQKAYNDYVDGILKKRTDAKLNKNAILWNGLFNFGKYGSYNPNTYIIHEVELKEIDPEELTALIKDMYAYDHRMFYYGQEDLASVIPLIDRFHQVPDELKPYPDPVLFVEKETDKSQVYFADYDMSQVNIILLSKGPIFDKELIPPARLFGEYFGGGLSSIVFQEIREARGLAYSAFSAFGTPAKMDESHFVYGFVGTQVDKLKEATDALIDLMNNMPMAPRQFEMARESLIKQIQTERIIKTNIFWTYQRNLDLGIDYDIRKDVYEYALDIDLDEFAEFFNMYIAQNNYSFLILGNRKMVDQKTLKKLGPVNDLTLEEVFGY